LDASATGNRWNASCSFRIGRGGFFFPLPSREGARLFLAVKPLRAVPPPLAGGGQGEGASNPQEERKKWIFSKL